MMKRKKRTGRSQALTPITSATPEQVERYARTAWVKHGPSIKDFRLDLRSSGLASAWKQRGTQIFVHHFMDSNEYTCRDEEAIENAFKTHLITLKSQYQKFTNDEDEPAGALAEKARQARRISVRQHDFHIH
jgi:hypothetical protein